MLDVAQKFALQQKDGLIDMSCHTLPFHSTPGERKRSGFNVERNGTCTVGEKEMKTTVIVQEEFWFS